MRRGQQAAQQRQFSSCCSIELIHKQHKQRQYNRIAQTPHQATAPTRGQLLSQQGEQPRQQAPERTARSDVFSNGKMVGDKSRSNEGDEAHSCVACLCCIRIDCQQLEAASTGSSCSKSFRSSASVVPPLFLMSSSPRSSGPSATAIAPLTPSQMQVEMEMQRVQAEDAQAAVAASPTSHVRFHVDDHDEASGAGSAAPRPSVSFKEEAPAPSKKESAASASSFNKSSSAPRSSLADVDEFDPPHDGLLRRTTSFLEHDENVRTVLVWQDLTVTSPQRGSNTPKVLLDHVSGSMTGQHNNTQKQLGTRAGAAPIRIRLHSS